MAVYGSIPESIEQFNRIYEGAAKYLYDTREDFRREIMKEPETIPSWQKLADALLLYRKRYTHGEELERQEARTILSALHELLTFVPTDSVKKMNKALVHFDALPEHVQRRAMSCALGVSAGRRGGPDWQEDENDRIQVDEHLDMLEKARRSGGHNSGR